VTGRRNIEGVTIWQRKTTWAYRLDAKDPLTGSRVRPYKGGFTSEEDALTAAIDARRRLHAGLATNPKRITVRDFYALWIAEIGPSLKPTTLASYDYNISAYINPVLGSRRIGDLTVQVLNQFYRHLLADGRSKTDKNTLMYQFWLSRQSERGGLGPLPRDMAAHCGTTLHAARAAADRFRRGRTPATAAAGLAHKSVKNIQSLMRRSLRDAVGWGYLPVNPADNAILPRAGNTSRARRQAAWTVEELARWLSVALQDRYDGIWALAATTGMRRSELAGARRDGLDLDGESLVIADTRVVVAGRAEDSDGKTNAGRRTISLDPFTVEQLRRYVERIDVERDAFGGDYPDHGLLVVNEVGRPLHPETITRRFNRLVERADVPRIRLHDVRHTYVTLALDAGMDIKLLSDRVGHANMGVTLQIYTHRSTGLDRAAAQHIGGLIASAISVDLPKPDQQP